MGSNRLLTKKSSISIIPLPAIWNPDQYVKPSTQGTDNTNTRIILISATFLLESFVSSSQKDIMFSNTAITVESAAKIINTKNKVPITLPPGIALNMLESVVNRKLAPTVEASAVSPPLYVKQAVLA